MIVVRDNQNRREAPPWMAGAAELQRRDGDGVCWWGIGDGGDAYLCGPHESATWRDLGEGYSVALIGKNDPRVLARSQLWCPVAPVADLQGRVWMAPSILSPDGERQFRTAYGDDFLPALTTEQEHARACLIAAVATGSGVPMPAGARWAADLLSAVNHTTPTLLARGALLDAALICGVLYLGAGLSPRLEVAHG